MSDSKVRKRGRRRGCDDRDESGVRRGGSPYVRMVERLRKCVRIRPRKRGGGTEGEMKKEKEV